MLEMNRADVAKEAMTSSEVLEEGNNLGAMFYQEAEQSAANEDVQLAGDMFGFEPHKGDQMVFGSDVKNEVDIISDGMRKQASEGFSPKMKNFSESKKRRDSPPPSQAYISHHPHEQAGQPLLDLSHQQQQRQHQATHVIHHRPQQEIQMQGYQQYQGGGFQQVLPHSEEIQFQQNYQQEQQQGRVYHMYEGEGGMELMEEQDKGLQEQHFIQYQGEKQEMEGHEHQGAEGPEGYENFCAPDKNIDDILKGTRGNEERKMQIEEWIKLVGV